MTEEIHPRDRMVLYCREAPDLFTQNANLLMNSLEPPADCVLTGLSKDIWTTASSHKQTLADLFVKLSFWRSISNYCTEKMPANSLFMGGSTLNGFGLKTSDVDFVYLTRSKVKHRIGKMKILKELSWIINVLKANPSISQAKILTGNLANKPFIRFKDLINGFEVDLMMNSMATIMNTHLLFRYTQVDWRVQPLGVIIKLFAKNQDFLGSGYASFTCFHLMLMLIHYLQCGASPAVVPCLHKRVGQLVCKNKVFEIDFFQPMNLQFDQKNQQTLEELLLGFFDYYNKFNFDKLVVSIKRGRAIPKNEYEKMVKKKTFSSYKTASLSLEEPYDGRNAAGKLKDKQSFNKARLAFRLAHEKLSSTRDINCIFSALNSKR